MPGVRVQLQRLVDHLAEFRRGGVQDDVVPLFHIHEPPQHPHAAHFLDPAEERIPVYVPGHPLLGPEPAQNLYALCHYLGYGILVQRYDVSNVEIRQHDLLAAVIIRNFVKGISPVRIRHANLHLRRILEQCLVPHQRHNLPRRPLLLSCFSHPASLPHVPPQHTFPM